MNKAIFFSVSILCFPLITHAQNFQGMLGNIVTFLSDIVIPFLLGIAFLFMVINGVRYFIFGSTSEDGRDKAKALAIYGVLAFVIIIIFWGIVNLLVDSIGLGGETQPDQDYVKLKTP